jgi:DNA repair protein RadD
MRPLRDYQQRAVDAVIRLGASGCRRICLVAPTGSGKTRMGVEFVSRAVRAGRRVLWLCHRDELQTQAAEAIGTEVGAEHVGIYGEPSEPDDPPLVTVATVQSLARGGTPEPSLTILDEAHHYQAAQWGEVARRYPVSALLGLTATPERADGRPLGDLFDGMIVAAHYSELIAGGYIVPCRVQVPVIALDSGTIAQLPLQAYREYGEGRSGFLFSESIESAEQHAADFRAAGIPAACISERTPRSERRAMVAGLASGVWRILTNVYALTEGVDVPAASVCILARGCGHVSPYLQMVGRVLRSAPGKRDALLLDLQGVALKHGSPTEDRDYSLGEGIAPGERSAGLRQCLACGYCWSGPVRACPGCGHVEPLTLESASGMALAGVALCDLTAQLEAAALKRQIMRDLRNRQRELGYGLYWVVRRYREVTGEDAPVTDATMEEKRDEYRRLEQVALQRGWQHGAIGHAYRRTFGVWPRGM